jgi:hypothetical protein
MTRRKPSPAVRMARLTAAEREAERIRKGPPNAAGCKPYDDVCLAHDMPLVNLCVCAEAPATVKSGRRKATARPKSSSTVQLARDVLHADRCKRRQCVTCAEIYTRMPTGPEAARILARALLRAVRK